MIKEAWLNLRRGLPQTLIGEAIETRIYGSNLHKILFINIGDMELLELF